MPDSSRTCAVVARARSGDVTAFEQLARQHAAMVYRVALKIVGNPQDAQDVGQRALLAAWQGLGRYRGDAAFETWLYQIARRHALNSVRCTARHAQVAVDDRPELPDLTSDPAEAAATRDAASQVRVAVAALPAPERLVVQLFHYQHLSYVQIAVATDSSEPAVRSRLYRARRSLATTLVDQR